MIKVTVRKTDDRFLSYEVGGHAYFDEVGSDIVCSAVSAITQTTLVSLNQVANIDDLIYEIDEGYLYCELPNHLSNAQAHDSKIILESMILGLMGIFEMYPENINIQVEEVQSDVN